MSDSPYRRGDIWIVDLGVDPVDPEQAFRRPGVIVSDDRLHHPSLRLVTVVPGTSRLRSLPLHVEVDAGADNGLDVTTAFQTEQIRAVSNGRLVERLGRLDAVNRHLLDETLRLTLRLT